MVFARDFLVRPTNPIQTTMEEAKSPAASFNDTFYVGGSSNGSQDNTQGKREKWATSVSARTKRAGFSDSFSCEDMSSLCAEEEEEEYMEEKGEKLGKDEFSPRGVLGNCSVGSTECETPSKASTISVGSETACTSPSPSGCEGQQGSIVAVHWRDLFRMFKKGPSKGFQPLKMSVPKLTRRKSKRIREEMVPVLNAPLDVDLCYLKSSWKNFALSELQAATNNFSRENLIGEGGYAEVYKGQLEDGQLVAIKRLTRGSPEEMTVDYLSELGIIVHVDHPNIARLVGYGVEGGMHLVLQLSANGSLASLLYGPKEKLSWGTRYKIALGAAEGLQYLHEGCQRRIIHKDIKAANILLTEDFVPQISDFGLAKWLPDQWTHHTVSKIEGTFGYLPPEFFMYGRVDEKTDVYAYGVLLLELITGREALDSSQQSLVMWAKPLLMKNKIKELVDPVLADAYDPDQMDRLVSTASMCIDQSSMQRPQMSEVVQILKGDGSRLEKMKRQHKSKLQRTYSEELLDAEEYNSTKYLNDLNRQMELVLGQAEI